MNVLHPKPASYTHGIVLDIDILQVLFQSLFVCLCLGHTNNVHCLAKAINSLAGAMFTVHGHGDVEMRLKEFLAVRFTHTSSPC